MNSALRVTGVAVLISLAPASGVIAGSIAENAVSPITQSDYPKTYKAWGKQAVDKINGLMQPAAEAMARSRECDRLEYMGLSESRSRPKDTIVFFGDCKNGKRFYVSEEDVAKAGGLRSEDSRTASVSDADFLRLCQAGLRQKLMIPSSFDPGWFGSAVNRYKGGRAVATVDFEAQNAFGAKIKHRGKCHLEGGALTAVELVPR